MVYQNNFITLQKYSDASVYSNIEETLKVEANKEIAFISLENDFLVDFY